MIDYKTNYGLINNNVICPAKGLSRFFRNRKELYFSMLLAVTSLLVAFTAALWLFEIGKPNHSTYSVKSSFNYVEGTDEVYLYTTDNQTVTLQFYEDEVVIKDSYLFDNPNSISEILSFVKYYTAKQGYEITRSDAELIGEYRLHTILFTAGYKQERTGTLNWNYVSDPHWYVNVTSNVLGWLGI